MWKTETETERQRNRGTEEKETREREQAWKHGNPASQMCKTHPFYLIVTLPNSHPEAVNFAYSFHQYPTNTNNIQKVFYGYKALLHILPHLIVTIFILYCKRILINLLISQERNFSVNKKVIRGSNASSTVKKNGDGKHLSDGKYIKVLRILFKQFHFIFYLTLS